MFMRVKIEKSLTAIFLMLFILVATHAFAQHSIEKHQTKTVSSNSNTYDIIKHKVKKGDNLSGLAYRYKTTVKDIKQSNKINREQVFLGEILKIPYNTKNAKGTEAFINYTIHRGDSLSIIAAKYKTDTKSIKIVNNLAKSQINVGQKIVIPYNKKYESSDSFKTDVSKKVVSKATEKPIPVKIEERSNKGYLKNIEEKYLSFVEKQKELLKANSNEKQPLSDKDSNKVVKSAAKTSEIAFSNDKNIEKTAQISDNDKNIAAISSKSKKDSIEKESVKSVQKDIKVSNISEDKKKSDLKANKGSTANPYIRYKVKSGDNLSTIAENYSLSTKELRTLNNLKSNQINIGQRIKIPNKQYIKSEKADSKQLIASSSKENSKSTGFSSTNQKSSAGKNYADLEKSIKKSLTDSDKKEVNVAKTEIKKTAAKKESETSYVGYVVKSGDSLSILAENSGITTKELMEVNGLTTRQINIGQRLRIPKEVENQNKKPEISDTVLVAKTDAKSGVKKEEGPFQIDSKEELIIIGVNSKKVASKPKEIAAQKTKNADSKIAEISKDSNENSVLVKADKKAVSLDTSIKTVQSENKANQNEIETSLDKNISKPNDKLQAIQVASEEKKEVITTNNNNQEVESKNGDSEKLNAANDTIKDSNLKKDELELNLQGNEQEMAGKLVYMPEEGEKLNEDITLAQLLTIENSNIAEQENRYENFLDDQIMLVANSENNERYETFAQKSPDTPTTINRPEKVDIDEGIVDIPDEIDLRDFVRTISEITRESYILDDKLKSKKVTIVTPKGGFNKKNAIRLFEAMLLLNGFTIYKKGIINVITETRNIKQKDIEVIKGKIISDPSDRFVTQIIPLKNISAQVVANTLKPLISREGDIVVYAPLNTLIIVETKSNLERLITILNNVDKEKDIIFVKIYNSEASDIAAMLTEIFGGASASPISTTARRGGDGAERRRSTRRSAARSSAGQSAGQSEIPGFKIITDERTNSLIIISYPEDIPKIKAAIERLDVEVAEPEHGIYVIRLKNGDAEQIVSVLNSLISGAATSGRTSRGFRATREAQVQANQARARGRGVTRASSSSEAAAIAEFSLEDIRITSDIATNSIIVVGSRREFESVKRVVDELDIRRRQVFVEAAILEVSLDQLRSIGTNLSIGFTIDDDNLGFGGTNLPGVPSLLGAAANAEGAVSLVGSLTGMFLGVIGEEVDVDGSGPIPPIPSFSALFQPLHCQ